MKNFTTLTKKLIELSDTISDLTLQTQRPENPDQHLPSLDTKISEIFKILPNLKEDLEKSTSIISNLVKERDLLLASKVMMSDRRESQNSDDLKKKIPNFDDFFFKEIDTLQTQMKNIIKTFKSKSEIKGDKMIQINALSLFILEYIKRNGIALREKFEQSDFYKRNSLKSKNQEFNDILVEAQRYMQGDSRRLSSMLNNFEFKKNFSVYEQNIQLKKSNFKYSEKIKMLNKRINHLVEKFNIFLKKKNYEEMEKKEIVGLGGRGFHLDFSKM